MYDDRDGEMKDDDQPDDHLDDAAAADEDATTAATPERPDAVRDISERVCRLLECPVCLSLAARLTCLCANGHVVCFGCLIRLNRQIPLPVCPMCRSPMVRDAYTAATTSRLSLITNALRVACPYRDHGCGDLLRLDQVTFHESECAYMPTARCLASTCQWVGVYGQLFEHRNRLSIHDANSITSLRRRSYLVQSPIGLFWVMLFKETRNRLRVGVFFVHKDSDVRSSVEPDRKKMYQVVWSDAEGKHRNKSSTALVGCSTSLKSWTHGIFGGRAHAYTMIKRNTGRLVVRWYERRTS